MRGNNILDYSKHKVTETLVLGGHGGSFTNEDRWRRNLIRKTIMFKAVESPFTRPAKNHSPRVLVLDKKKARVKLKEHIVIFDKFKDR